MLLIWSCAEDKTVDWFIKRYLSQNASIKWARFNTEEFPEKVRLRMTTTGFCVDGGTGGNFTSSDISAVWYRRPARSVFTSYSPETEVLGFIQEESERTLRFVRDFLTNARWVNDPEDNNKASQKIRQLQIASENGFRCPETLITNDHEAAAEFAEKQRGEAIIKPIHRGGVWVGSELKHFYTTRITAEKLRLLKQSVDLCPLIFQEVIEKDYELRVVVVGDECFAVKLHSQQGTATITDWRRAPYNMEHSIFELPGSIAEKCCKIAKESRLLFTAFDLAVTRDREFVFFEHNPNGQFAWLEEKTGIPIGQSLMKLFAVNN